MDFRVQQLNQKTKRTATARLLSFVLAICALVVLSSCAKGRRAAKEEFVSDCSIIPGQENAYQGYLDTVPVKILLQAGAWSGTEPSSIVAAANTWNDFFSTVHGANIFDSGDTLTSSQSLISPTCAVNVSTGVIVYKRTVWTKSASIVATTSILSCSAPPGPQGFLPIRAAIMDFNYVNFNNGNKVPDLQSIMLHELGHLIGLDHSCNGLKNGLSNIACPDPASDPSNFLFDTVMHPDVSFFGNVGEVKRSLSENDQGRTNCLYQ